MSCTTCGHTMALFGQVGNDNYVYYCARCGTVKTVSPNGFTEIYVPALVKRCKDFISTVAAELPRAWIYLAHKLGILESIYLPEDRPNI